MMINEALEGLRTVPEVYRLSAEEVRRRRTRLREHVVASEGVGDPTVDFALRWALDARSQKMIERLAARAKAYVGQLALKVERPTWPGGASGDRVDQASDGRVQYVMGHVGHQGLRFETVGTECHPTWRLTLGDGPVAVAHAANVLVRVGCAHCPGLFVTRPHDFVMHDEEGLLPGSASVRTSFNYDGGKTTDVYVGDDDVMYFFLHKAGLHGHAGKRSTQPLRVFRRLAALIDDPLVRTLTLAHLRSLGDEAERQELVRLVERFQPATRALEDRTGLERALVWMDRFGMGDDDAVRQARELVETRMRG